MIQQETYLTVADNSGAKRLQCVLEFLALIEDMHMLVT